MIDLGKICVEENSCEFLERFFCPNSGTATEPPHACDLADIFMGELDKLVVQQLEEKDILTTGWTIYRDDAWIVALDGLSVVPMIEEVLQNLHPNIKWEVNPRGPTVPPVVMADGRVQDMNVLEHLDLSLHFVENHIETDVFAKDIPIYVSKKSCHPPLIFKSIVKSVGLRLRANCSLDTFLSPRIEEYTNYFVASDYDRKEVKKILEDCSKVDRVELIKRPRKNKRVGGGPKKYVLCSKWDPRQPNVREGLKMMEDILYLNKENETVFPRGSLIAGFRRQKNVGEIVAPSKPQRVAVEHEEGGCSPCQAPRSCTLHQSGALQTTNHVISRYDGQRHNIKKKVDCSTKNVVYYILCSCGHPLDYVGSTKDMKARWSKHKWDIRNENWTACGLTTHFGQYHRGDQEEAISNLKVTLLDSVSEVKNLKKKENQWMCNIGTLFVGGNTRNEILSQHRVNFGRGTGRT